MLSSQNTRSKETQMADVKRNELPERTGAEAGSPHLHSASQAVVLGVPRLSPSSDTNSPFSPLQCEPKGQRAPKPSPRKQ